MSRYEFGVRASILVAVIATTALLLLACWASSTAILLLFAAGLLAVFLNGLAEMISSRTRLSDGVSLVVTVVGLTALTVGLGWLLAPAAIAQASDLALRLPAEVTQLRDQVARTTWGSEWLGVTEGGGPAPDGSVSVLTGYTAELVTAAAGVAGGIAKGAVAILLVVPAGLYFAAQPALYFEGALRLLPMSVRAQARDIAHDVVHRLGWWLIGQVALMAMVSTATGFGLWALGVPLALILALLRGALNFIPNFGPVIATIPALILAAGLGGNSFLGVAVLYAVIQIVETYVMTPIVNGRTVHMAPMLLVGAQLVLGELLGFFGIMLAAPLTVVAMVLVQRLYLERVLGEEPTPSDEPVGAAALA